MSCAIAQTGEISGKMKDVNGEGIRKGTVTLNDTTGNKLGSIIADIDGNFTLKNVPAGKYNLYFSATKYVSSFVNGVIVIPDRSTWVADVYLSLSPRKKK